MTKKSQSLLEEIQAGFFGDYLVAQRMITPEHLKDALSKQRETKRRVGEILVELGHLGPETLVQALADFNVQIRLGELLISAGHLKYMQLLDALEEQRQSGDPLGQVLVRLGFCQGYQVEEALDRQAELRQGR